MKKNVLVVDRHHGVQKLLVDILENKGYQVSTEADGHDALTRFALDRPDLVITSLRMPSLNGYQLCRLIRGISSVPVLLRSSQPGVEEKAYRFGANGFLSKPFDLEDMWSEIEDLLLEKCGALAA